MKIILIFLNKYEETHKELIDLTYHTRRASTILAFGGCRQGVVFLPVCFHREKKVLKGCVDALTIERNWCLEDILEVSVSFTSIEAFMEYFNYPDTLVKKVKLLAQKATEKNKHYAKFVF